MQTIWLGWQASVLMLMCHSLKIQNHVKTKSRKVGRNKLVTFKLVNNIILQLKMNMHVCEHWPIEGQAVHGDNVISIFVMGLFLLAQANALL